MPEYTLYDAEGEVESSDGFDDTFGFEFAYVEEAGHWQLFEAHPIGIDEFLAEAGMEDAQPDLTR